MAQISSLLDKLRAKGWKLTTAESCTGGMISAAITDIAGSSDVFDRGFITYATESKVDLLNVSRETLDRFGAVSAECCTEMLSGALDNSVADVAIAVTGIAGPGGATDDKPVGLVYIGIATRDGFLKVTKNQISGDRAQVRQATMEKSFQLLDSII